MARLEAQSKLLYYPTPDWVVALIASHFTARAAKIRLVDPCCGTGAALQQLTQQLKTPTVSMETWGIELSYSRAVEATQVLDVVLPASFYAVNWSDRSVSIAFNNPPYDWSDQTDEKGRKVRHELLFVQQVTPRLVVGGHQVIIVPRAMLNDIRLARHLIGWYTQVQVARFPDRSGDGYEAFGQIVIFAIGRREKYIAPGKTEIAMLTDLIDLPILTTGVGETVIPACPADGGRFNYVPATPEDLVRAARASHTLASDTWSRATAVRPIGEAFEVAMPLQIGHGTMMISGGQLGVLPIETAAGPTLLKGTTRKVVEIDNEDHVDADGKYASTKVEARERLRTTLTLASASGTEEVTEAAGIGDLVVKHKAAIWSALQARYRPLYNFDPTLYEWAQAGRIGQGLPPLPGRAERGPFDAQRHFGIAAKRVMQKRRHAIINAEMGTGKTLITEIALYELGEWPVLVVCPDHMLQKWFRDLQVSSDPSEPVTARIITRPIRPAPQPELPVIYPIRSLDRLPTSKSRKKSILSKRQSLLKVALKSPLFAPDYVPGTISAAIEAVDDDTTCRWHTRLQPALEATGATILDTTRWQIEPTSINDPGRRRRIDIACERGQIDRVVKVLKRFATFRDDGKRIEPVIQLSVTGLRVEIVDLDDYTLADFAADYAAGRLGPRAVAIIGFERAKYDAGRISIPMQEHKVWDEEKKKWIMRLCIVCPECGMAHTGSPSTCTALISKPLFDAAGKLQRNKSGQVMNRSQVCGAALYNFNRWRRIGLAQLVKRQHRQLFKVYTVDEIHKAQGARTDIGCMDSRLLATIPHSLALTGTLFGGTAGSLFPLLYRRNPEVRALYSYEDYTRWVDHYGIWKSTWTQYAPFVTGVGLSSGIERWGYRQTELAGVSPAVIRFLLPLTIFGNITDLGYTLPAVTESIEEIEMTTEQRKQYDQADADLLRKAMQIAKKDRDPGALASWLITTRFRPNSAFRPETVDYTGKKGSRMFMELPAITNTIDRFLPKEKRLAAIVQANATRGRKTLVFIEQTGTRDIRPRLRLVLESLAGAVDLAEVEAQGDQIRLRIESLGASDLAPHKREAWIRQTAPNTDALLVNAKLVETGLDLIMYSDIVFYELNTSLYVCWQAMRRVWRLGQANHVTVTFLVYRESCEADLLRYMGQKMKFAMYLYGKEATGALIENDDDDFERARLRAALRGVGLESVGEALTQIGGLFTSSLGREETVTPLPPVGEAAVTVLVSADSEPVMVQLNLFGDPMLAPRRNRHRL
jgi:hypothetical protein